MASRIDSAGVVPCGRCGGPSLPNDRYVVGARLWGQCPACQLDAVEGLWVAASVLRVRAPRTWVSAQSAFAARARLVTDRQAAEAGVELYCQVPGSSPRRLVSRGRFAHVKAEAVLRLAHGVQERLVAEREAPAAAGPGPRSALASLRTGQLADEMEYQRLRRAVAARAGRVA
ncbi:hypothetical protein [Kitasatospora cineracea]|uniref:Uncharacterized protein n=1 Tax=Kitasatospora cineracea TaxID=88074 RepID=A0A3N4R016_9ACTN|nr:hypothetical protein [Kitasatospora cineracea]RPE26618.1 hypothetical protein EDD38_7680 [Kitasatospora cineracea]